MNRYSLLNYCCRWLAVSAGVLVSSLAVAQTDYPARPVRIVVPFPPGGATDIIGRIAAESLTRAFDGKPFIIENVGGAGGTIGTDRVAKAAPDGHILLVATLAANATAPSVYAKLPYDPAKDFVYITPLAFAANALLVSPKLGVGTVAELIAHAKANPGKLAFSSPGIGISNHLAMELFLREAGISGLHVPYKGSGPAIAALIAAEVQMSLDPIASSLSHLRAGTLRALAVSGRTRSTLLPDVPTIAEAGVRNVEAYTWNGLAAPAGTPASIVERLNAAVSTAFKQPELRERLLKMGAEAIDMSPSEFQAFIRTEAGKWGDIARRTGARVE